MVDIINVCIYYMRHNAIVTGMCVHCVTICIFKMCDKVCQKGPLVCTHDKVYFSP